MSIDIGYVVGLDKTEVTIADALVYGKVVSKFKMADVVNGTDQALSVGDKILYRRMGQNDRNLVVQSILGHHVPTAPNMETFLSRLRYAADDLGEASDQFREVMEQAINGRFVIVGHDHAEIVTKLTEDVGTRQCPNLLSTDADLSSGFPVVIEVPDVSGNTLTYLHRIAKPSDTDKVLRIRLISYRFLHLLFHATGYHEHMPDFGLLARNLEAGDRGDPSQLTKEVPCLMSWEGLHLLGTRETSRNQLVTSLLCEKCSQERPKYSLENLKTLTRALGGTRLPREHSSSTPFGYYVGYVLESSLGGGVLLGGAPIVRASTYEVTRETEAYDIGTALAQGKSVRVPGDMWGPNGTPQVGRKVLIEFIETLNLETDERTLTKAKVVENIGGLHRIIRPESLLSKLGLRGQHLTIRLKWANGVERNSLRTAGKVVSQLTGWKTHIDSAPDVRLNQHADRIAELGKTISETKDPAVHRVALVALQDVIDEISPTRGDVEDLPNVIILVLPKLPGIPFTTAGDVATGVTKHWLYSVMFMPPKFGPVQLVSEACAACSKNYAKGRDYDYASHFGLLIIHESLHVAAELRDHRGECRLCTYDREEMLPLRYEHCEDCIGHEGNYTHQNCIMSYACQFCIASRIRELKGLSDILCNQCHSRIPETSLILSSYYFRVNSLLYRDLVMKALSTSTRERLNVARKTREQERSSPTIK